MGYEISLEGKKGLVIGIANSDSIAYGCAKVMKGLGAELAVTYLNEKAESYVRPLAEAMDAPIIRCCDVEREGDLKGLFDELNLRWGRLDFLLHAIAYAPKEDLGGRVTDSSASGFALAMDVSVHSFIRAAKLAEPLMTHGGAMITADAQWPDQPPGGALGPAVAEEGWTQRRADRSRAHGDAVRRRDIHLGSGDGRCPARR